MFQLKNVMHKRISACFEAGSMMDEYNKKLKDGLQKAYAVATQARKKGYDPVEDVEVRVAQDVAARVENIVGPPNIAKIIRDMEKGGMSREDIAFEIARKIAAGEVIKGNREFLIEQAVRTGVGILTEGVLVAPTEGISKAKIKKNPDGSDYIAIYYAGPIRSAGGTAAALSLVLADIARRAAGVGDYRVTDSQVERYLEEINVYEARVTHLQYFPPEEDIRVIVKSCPVCVDGDPTEDIEVSAYKGVPGVETDRVRGGVPLVICEGVALKSAKLLKYTRKLKLNWDWLEKIIKIRARADKIEIKPDSGYLDGVVAGRPVFSHASAKGGFRLRYGRSETNGLMSKNVHPATMTLLDNFLAYGTHMKIERPGKGCVVVPHTGIEPPIVKLNNGRVMKVKSSKQADEIKKDVEEILFLGDLLCAYGDFLKSNHPLMPSGYCIEIWKKELEELGTAPPEKMDAKDAFGFSREHGAPLHPDYTYPWHDLSVNELKKLADWLKTASLSFDGDELKSVALKPENTKRILEVLLVEHGMYGERIVLDGETGYSVLASLGMIKDKTIDASSFDAKWNENKDALKIVNEASGVKIRPWSPTYIGARMGRPEKAKERMMAGKPHVLFPTGSFKNRSLSKQYRMLKGKDRDRAINIEIARFRCSQCGTLTFYRRCHSCGGKAEPDRICVRCGKTTTSEIHCEAKTAQFDKRPVDLISLFEKYRAESGTLPEEVKGVKGLSNATRVPERFEKGIIRAKHDVYVFRDGTSRFDATDVTLTHFVPKDVGITAETAAKLGYSKDHLGNPLERGDQTVPLFPQDIVLSENGANYFMRVAAFIDEILIDIYGIKPFYNIKKKEDLIGHLCLGLSPHTSASVLCRVIGFTGGSVGYGHPYFHTAKRRNCFSGDTKIPIFENNEWKIVGLGEFVEEYLENPEKDNIGTLYSKLRKDIKTLAFNQRNKKFEMAPITHVSKHQISDILTLKTKSGREIKVTSDHPFPGPEGKKTASEIDKIYAPAKIEISEKDLESFDLAEYTDDVMVRIEQDLFIDKNKKEFCRERNLNYKTFTNYIYRGSYPFELAEEMADINEFPISAKRDNVIIKPKVQCNENFMLFLGMYTAEGHIRKTEDGKSVYQTGIAAANAGVRKMMSETTWKLFGKHPSENKNGITICSRIISSFIENLGCGRNAREKKIPSFILSLPKNKVRAFLSGIYTGDGSVSISSTLEVNLSTVSKELVDGISFLLSRFGIIHSISIKDDKNPKHARLYKIRSYGTDAVRFIKEIGFFGEKQEKAEKLIKKWETSMRKGRKKTVGDVFVDSITKRKLDKKEQTYSLTVSPHHTVIANGIISHQCDGDEDSVMLLLDALINFSWKYLDEKRGGTMDAPLVLTTTIDPKEVDDESHCIEVVSSYPLEFYRAAEKITPPGDIKLKTVKNVLGTEEQYQFPITHPGTLFRGGNTRTAYVTLETIPEKIATQFSLQERIRAVDQKDAASRLILSHFIPDLYGNLRSYSRQTFRCVSCNTIYRRVPLAGKCVKCGGNLLLTINKGGIEKYLQISRDIVERYELPDYTRQRLELIEKEIDSIFEDEKRKQMGLSDFL